MRNRPGPFFHVSFHSIVITPIKHSLLTLAKDHKSSQDRRLLLFFVCFYHQVSYILLL